MYSFTPMIRREECLPSYSRQKQGTFRDMLTMADSFYIGMSKRNKRCFLGKSPPNSSSSVFHLASHSKSIEAHHQCLKSAHPVGPKEANRQDSL